MPDTAKSAVPREPSAQTHNWEAPFGAFLEGSQQAYARWFQTMFALSQEITRFAQSRLQEDMAAWAKLASCHNPAEAMECQRRYSATAATQYGEEIGKLSQMMTGMAVTDFFSTPQPRKSAGS
ncbi:MAG: phasin family protein [Stellaceae bacterium]